MGLDRCELRASLCKMGLDRCELQASLCKMGLDRCELQASLHKMGLDRREGPVYTKWDWTDVKGQSTQNGTGQM